MYNFSAKVVKGRGRGKRIGFPTINLDKKNLDIEKGVYLAEIIFNNKTHRGLLHFGEKKTFKEGISVEVYIKDFNLNIYGQIVNIKIGKKIREIKKFNSIKELKGQISEDIKILSNKE